MAEQVLVVACSQNQFSNKRAPGTTVLSASSSMLPFNGVTGIKDLEADLTE